jgi:hypothetical protein
MMGVEERQDWSLAAAAAADMCGGLDGLPEAAALLAGWVREAEAAEAREERGAGGEARVANALVREVAMEENPSERRARL